MPFLAAIALIGMPSAAQNVEWPAYGGDLGGRRYSAAKQINRKNLLHLKQVWEYHTHVFDTRIPGSYSASFESTPVLFHGVLYLSSPLDDVIALEPTTGAERWHYRPQLTPLHDGDLITSRGVSTWEGHSNDQCNTRVFIGTDDAKLIALDAVTGTPCLDFGRRGSIDLRAGLAGRTGEFHITSAPTVVGDTIIVGSSIPDNISVNAAEGTVRAFDARTGHPRWSWDPIPWSHHQSPETGAANTWSTIAADPDLGLVYLPTGSASPDYYGGLRLGDDRDSDSVVALDVTTGRKIWSFQVVHHDLWDYDIASEPLLFTWHGTVPALAVATKMGILFVLDRRNGHPLFPIQEKPVPISDVKGEKAWPTQPASLLPAFSPSRLPLNGASPSRSPADQENCRRQLVGLRYDGAFTPPSLRGSVVFPGAVGGVNWGSFAYDPLTGVLYANTNRLPYFVQLTPSTSYGLRTLLALASTPSLVALAWLLAFAFILRLDARKKSRSPTAAIAIFCISLPLCASGLITRAYLYRYTAKSKRMPPRTAAELRSLSLQAAFGNDHSPQELAPYSLQRHPIVDSHGNPCAPEPWGTVSAINLQTGQIEWEVPHGTQMPGRTTGAISLGGVIVTAGGLVFSAGTREPLLRAYNSSNGRELWRGQLPVPAQSTPMTYQINGQQFVVLAAGGHGLWGTPQGDSVVAFALQ